MSNKSKIISLLCFFLSTLLLFTSCTSSSNEETAKDASSDSGTKSDKVENGKLNIVIGGGTEAVYAKPGDEVALKIELVNNTAISSLKVVLSYDPKLSPVTEINSEGEDAPKVTFNITDDSDDSVMKYARVDKDKGTVTVNWLTAMKEVKGDTVYATVLFKVAEGAAEGDFLSVTADINPNDVFDINLDNIDFNLINGGITVG